MVHARLAALEPRSLALERVLCLQRRDHADHGLGVVAGLREIARAETVGLELGLAAIAADDRLAGHVGEVGKRRHAGEDRGCGAREAGEHALALLLLQVLRGDVADLVAEHGREVRLVLEVRQDAARDVDVPAHGREGVHVVGVDDREVPFELGHLADRGELVADALDVFLQFEVAMHAHLLGEGDVHLLRGADVLAFLLRLRLPWRPQHWGCPRRSRGPGRR